MALHGAKLHMVEKILHSSWVVFIHNENIFWQQL